MWTCLPDSFWPTGWPRPRRVVIVIVIVVAMAAWASALALAGVAVSEIPDFVLASSAAIISFTQPLLTTRPVRPRARRGIASAATRRRGPRTVRRTGLDPQHG